MDSGQAVPAMPFEPDFVYDLVKDNNVKTMRLYTEMLRVFGVWGQPTDTGISQADFNSNYCIFCFRFSEQDVQAAYKVAQPISGYLRVVFKFHNSTKPNVYQMVCLGVYQSNVRISAHHAVSVDYIMGTGG